MGQTLLSKPALVDQIKRDMMAGAFCFDAAESRLYGWKDARGTYYISEGHHRVVAALEICWESGDRSHLDRLLECGVWWESPPQKIAGFPSAACGRDGCTRWGFELKHTSRSVHILECSGFRLGRLDVPPFELGPGEIVKLIAPRHCAAEIDRLLKAFCAKAGGHLRIEGPIAAVELPMTRSALREFFHRQTAAEWLMARSGMSRDDAVRRLTQVAVNADAPLSTLAGNPRWLIGFLAANFQQPSALVFTTVGCDASGIRQALATADARLGSACGMYLTCFPDVGIPEPDYTAVLEVIVREPEPPDGGPESSARTNARRAG